MDKKIYYNVEEEVNYFSCYDHNWKTGIITRFTEDGLRTVAIIWEDTPNGNFANRIPLNDEYIKKLQ